MQINKSDFDIVTLEDEIRVDGLCKGLLMEFYELQLAEGVDPATATRLANGADHFVRDFLVGAKMLNLFTERKGLVRQFAGNWYIVNTIEPKVEYLVDTLPGVASFYRFLSVNGLISEAFCRQIEAECGDISFYESRIESFWEITGDGYADWERGCTIQDRKTAAGKA